MFNYLLITTAVFFVGPLTFVRGQTIPLLGNLEKILAEKETANIFITLSDGPEKFLTTVIDQTLQDRGNQIESLTHDLQEHANKTQQVVINLLNQYAATTGQNLTIKQYWISNQIYVQGANKILILLLQTLGSVIGYIKEEVYAGFGPMNPQVAELNDDDEYTWGQQKIDAPGAWSIQSSLRAGDPVLIASIDSGVRYTHLEVAENFVQDYGWYDPVEETPFPNDDNGHGTHTMATIVGKNVGIANSAKWMSCKGCQTDVCAQSDVLSCGQFLLCPTKPDGTSPDCSKAPLIINNSWGNDRGGDNTYKAMVEAWRSAGIIPIFSVGNSGPWCRTATSPGDYNNVISVGSSTSKNEISQFSSKGPSGGVLGIGGSQKPDLSAPGENIISAWNTGDHDYRKLSGTSMAAPHVTGVVALMFAAKGNMTFDKVKDDLLKGTTQDGRRPFLVCEPQFLKFRFPNNEFGQGILNAKNTLLKTIS